jgi:cysteine-rich repeat protein
MCEVGASQTAVSEKTACNLNGVDGAGWCLGGECVPTNCGDGQVGGNEECDLGDKNGVPESGCTKDCKTQKCGNKIVEGTEECDDGNREDLDTCDKSCKSEFWYRYTMMSITKETAPDWCVYSTKNTGDPTSGGNQFGNAFAGDVSIPGTGTATTPAMKINIVDTINQLLTSVFTSCQSNVLNKVVDSDDVSFQTTDESIGVAVYDGALDPAESSSRCGNVDTRFSIRVGKDQDATNPIVSSFSTAQRPGLISSIAPSDIVSQIPGIGTIKLYKLMVRIPVDMEPLSTPKAPPAVSETVKRPEKIGFNDANPKPDPYFPSGRLCAAVGVDSMKQVGVANTLDGADGSPLAICCKADATKFDQCNTAAGDVPGKNCDTFLDIMKYGCKICMKSLADGVPLCGSACDTEPIEIIRATQPDVDVDGDGAKDAYSAVIAAEAVRVRVTGIK